MAYPLAAGRAGQATGGFMGPGEQPSSDNKEPLSLFVDGPEKNFRKQRYSLGATAFIIVAALAVASLGAFGGYKKLVQYFAQESMVYFEIRAISQSGHPIAGAEVALGDSVKGMTDSFGEWRQYLSLNPGANLVMKLSKTIHGESYKATKNLVVPIKSSRKGGLSIVKTIALKPMAVSVVEKHEESEPKKAEPSPEMIVEEVAEQSEPQKPDFAFDSINVVVEKKHFARGNVLGKKRFDVLQGPTLSQLKAQLKGAGLALDGNSPWRVSLRHLSAGKGKSLIEVTSTFGDNQASFVRNYYKDPRQTAQKIKSLLRFHSWKAYRVFREGDDWFAVAPSETARYWLPKAGAILLDHNNRPVKISAVTRGQEFTRFALATSAGQSVCPSNKDCLVTMPTFANLKPNPGWQRYRVNLGRQFGDRANFYFSGFAGQREDGNVVSYWGVPGGGTNITIVQNGRVVMRKRMKNLQDHVPTIALPTTTIADRKRARATRRQ